MHRCDTYCDHMSSLFINIDQWLNWALRHVLFLLYYTIAFEIVC